MFALTRDEIMNLSQIVINSRIKHAPNVLVFTAQGVAMHSGVLNSGRAVQVNIAMMRTFVKLREMLSSNKKLACNLMLLKKKIEKHDGEIKAIDSVKNHVSEASKRFEGEMMKSRSVRRRVERIRKALNL